MSRNCVILEPDQVEELVNALEHVVHWYDQLEYLTKGVLLLPDGLRSGVEFHGTALACLRALIVVPVRRAGFDLQSLADGDESP